MNILVSIPTRLRVATALVMSLWLSGISAEEKFTYSFEMDGRKFEFVNVGEMTESQYNAVSNMVARELRADAAERKKHKDPGGYHLEATSRAMQKCTEEKKLPANSCKQMLTPEKCQYTLPLDGNSKWWACILACGHSSWYDKKFGECSTELDLVDWKPREWQGCGEDHVKACR